MPLLPSPLLAGCVLDEEEADGLFCPICFGLMMRPRRLPGCAVPHTFCCECITFWLQQQQQSGGQRTCPIDRRVLPASERPCVDDQIEEVLRRQRVRCPNSSLGCTERFSLEQGTAHLSVCTFRTVQCTACKKPQSAEALPRHIERCYKICDACGVAVPRIDAYHHSFSLCLARPQSWRSINEVHTFRHWRDVSLAELHWIVAHCSDVVDWQRLYVACHEMLGQTGGGIAVGADVEGGPGADSVDTWQSLAELCVTRWWRGPCLAFCSHAAALDPTSSDAMLALASAEVSPIAPTLTIHSTPSRPTLTMHPTLSHHPHHPFHFTASHSCTALPDCSTALPSHHPIPHPPHSSPPRSTQLTPTPTPALPHPCQHRPAPVGKGQGGLCAGHIPSCSQT